MSVWEWSWLFSCRGLGGLLCREEPLTLGLDGVVGEHLGVGLWFDVGEGLGLASLQMEVGLDEASAWMPLRVLGLSMGRGPPVRPELEVTGGEVRGRGTGVWLTLEVLSDRAGTGGVFLPTVWPESWNITPELA